MHDIPLSGLTALRQQMENTVLVYELKQNMSVNKTNILLYILMQIHKAHFYIT